MGAIEYYKEFMSIYNKIFEIPYEVTIDKIDDEYHKTFLCLSELSIKFGKDLSERVIRGNSQIVRNDKVDPLDVSTKVYLGNLYSNEYLSVSLDKRCKSWSTEAVSMDRDSLAIFSCFCIILCLYNCSVDQSDNNPLLELIGNKIPKFLEKEEYNKFCMEFRRLYGMNSFRVRSIGFTGEVIKVAEDKLM
jgi:hypothetical protein